MPKPNAKPPHERPTGAQRTALRNALRGMGYSNAEASRLIKDGVTRAEMVAEVIAAQRTAPRGNR